jgi:hypothetical protein
VLALPALVLSSALSSVLLVAAVGVWFVGLFTAQAPRGLRDLLAFCLRYDAQANAYLLLLTDVYPYSGPTLATGDVPEPAAPAAPSSWDPPVPPSDWSSRPEAV